MADTSSPPPDPLQAWRAMRDAATERWAKAMTELVGSEAFARTLGASIDAYLATAAPLQKAIGEYMEATLAQLNMPSREDVLGVARRLTNVETRLDDLDARLDELEAKLDNLDAALARLLTAQPGAAPEEQPSSPPRRSARRSAKETGE
ncbi:MAG: hypothetical protein RMM58_09340 [Chloroflexota bacterium]|nr:accessory factor UbiK family protein [Dehalococcoidia bacterium]MDW8254070.1 hypothetical protein [Chloroflexota bacterium]